MADIWTAIPLSGGVVKLSVGVCEVTLTPAGARHLASALRAAATRAERQQASKPEGDR